VHKTANICRCGSNPRTYGLIVLCRDALMLLMARLRSINGRVSRAIHTRTGRRPIFAKRPVAAREAKSGMADVVAIVVAQPVEAPPASTAFSRAPRRFEPA
jgi:hypothetical protein